MTQQFWNIRSYISVALLVWSVYFLGIWLFRDTGSTLLTVLIGLVILFGLIPWGMSRVLNLQFISRLETWLGYVAITFFALLPPFFFFHLFGMSLTPEGVTGALVGITVVITLLLVVLRRMPELTMWQWFGYDRMLVAVLLLYAGMHIANYSFYHFAPEWDTYDKMLEITRVSQTGRMEAFYRGFFTSSMATISGFLHIRIYDWFTFGMIALQSTLLCVIAALLRQVHVTRRWLRWGVLLGALAVPLITLEIDTIRPQNMVIIGFPLYVYFLGNALRASSPTGWFLATCIAFFGLNYHEFFGFLCVFHAVLCFVVTLRRYIMHAQHRSEPIIWGLFLLVILLAAYSVSSHIPFIGFARAFVRLLFERVTHTEAWTWWFIDSYNSDGAALDIGWPGLVGAVKYYGYYLSPWLALASLTVIAMLFQPKPKSPFDPVVGISVTFIMLTLLFSEVLPRFNFVYLPERLWLLTDLFLLMLVPAAASWWTVSPRKRIHRWVSVVVGVAVVIGMGASVYVAHGKKALTSVEEYAAAHWIASHTEPSAIFITQPANGPMVKYFAERRIVVPTPSYFTAPEILTPPTELTLHNLVVARQQNRDRINGLSSTLPAAKNNGTIEHVLEEIRSLAQRANELDREVQEAQERTSAPLYVMYSYHKLNGLYAERTWWSNANFVDAQLEKFTSAYPIVYNQDDVLIWKVK